MKQYIKVKPDTGLFEEDVLLESTPLMESGEQDPSYIETPCPPGFYWPRWSYETQQWEEGGTAPEQPAQMPTQEERIAALEAGLLEVVMGGAF